MSRSDTATAIRQDSEGPGLVRSSSPVSGRTSLHPGDYAAARPGSRGAFLRGANGAGRSVRSDGIVLRFQLGRAFLDQLDDVVDHPVIGHLVVLLARHIDHARPRPAAGKADIGQQRLARAVHHAADDRQAHRRLDMRQPVFEDLDRLDDVETLARAGRAGNDLNAAGPQAQRLEDLVPDPDLFDRIGRQAHADRVADPGP
eukprot:m.268114 g.268114  ORF g.268114 m.268114 type:complete len:201 (-) comp73419_c0_seq1:124-726(-)